MNEETGLFYGRKGIVSALDASQGKARVKFLELDVQVKEDDPGLVSGWLTVTQQWSTGAREFSMPKLGQLVLVLVDQYLEEGYILFSAWTAEDTPPADAPATGKYLDFEDGTQLYYDPVAHLLTGNIQGDMDLELTGDATINAGGDAIVQAGGNAKLKGATITLDGPVTCTSTLHVDAAITSDAEITNGTGIALGTHKHVGVSAGGATSGTPVP